MGGAGTSSAAGEGRPGVTDESPRMVRYCLHCGAANSVRLGNCKVCHEMVCEHCGNTQLSQGVRYAIHGKCLRHDDGSGFSMIKFVK